MLTNIFRTALLALLVPVMVSAQVSDDGKPVVTVTNADVVGYTTWTNNNVYLMDGKIWVEAGDTLEIEPGTIIKAEDGLGTASSALIVTREGYIIAQGSPSSPIIFTTKYDDLDDKFDIPAGDAGRGLWGGVIILGQADINTTTGVGQIEGIDPLEPRARYGGEDLPGGPNDAHSSGIFSYVSIRHGGTEIGTANEINGLTMGGVGSGTKIDHIEVFQNKDDGYEWFGGTVDCKYLISAFCGDDNFDIDEGYRGRGQYWFCLLGDDASNRAGEHDGGTTPEDGTPLAQPVIYNATYIGAGVGAVADNDLVFKIRDNCAPSYYNSVFVDFKDLAIDVEDLTDPLLEDSRARLEAGDFDFQNNLWFGFDAHSWADPDIDANSAIKQGYVWDVLIDPAQGKNNDNVDPQINMIDRGQNGLLDPSPAPTSPAATGAGAPIDPFFDAVPYQGAFPADDYSWAETWSFLDYGDFFKPGNNDNGTTITVTNADVVGRTVWTADNTYLMDGKIWVEAGDTLVIEAGTVIKAEDGLGTASSALIVTREGYILAQGTATKPIIFTTKYDDVDDAYDIPMGDAGRGLWGGVIILGQADINTATGVGQIEGIDPLEPRARYGGEDLPGGPNDAHSSGVFSYVSIRHGGTEIGTANEINGLTMGGVGSGTQIDHIEVFQNKDDGFEWFGGTVDCKYLIAAYCGDDCFDIDEGYRGRGQYLLALLGDDASNRAGEHDGGTTPEDGTPLATPVFWNATYIGAGSGAAADNDLVFKIRDNCAPSYFSSIFVGFKGEGIDVEDLTDPLLEDSRARLEAGDFDFQDNIWWDFGGGNTLANIAPDQFVQDILFTSVKRNWIVNPGIASIDRGQNGLLDPRPSATGYATQSVPTPSDPFFDAVGYRGAFDPLALKDSEGYWLRTWTFLDQGNFIGDVANPGCCVTRGDLDGSGAVNVSDLTYLVAFLFQGGANAACNVEADLDDTGTINVSDLTYLVAFLFQGGTPPPACQ